MHRIVILFTLICLLHFPASSQVVDEETIPSWEETSTFEPQHDRLRQDLVLPSDTLNAWRNAKPYSYMKTLEQQLRREHDKVMSMRDNSKGVNPGFFIRLWNSPVWRLLFWVIAAGVVLLILRKLVFQQGSFRKQESSGVAEIKDKSELPFLEEDFNLRLAEALKQSDYRQALRYRFMNLLQLMHTQGKVFYTTDKTNNQYMQELGPEFREGFAALTLPYEYVWYGEYPINMVQYNKLSGEFDAYIKKVTV